MRRPRPFRRRRRGDVARSGDEIALALYLRLRDGDPRVAATLAGLEPSVAGGTPEQRQAFGIDVLETLQNLVSHPDSGVDPAALRDALGPATRRLSDELDAWWSRVADRLDVTGPSPTAVPREDVYAVADEALAALARGSYRTLPDGRFVGLTDVVRYSRATGETFRAS